MPTKSISSKSKFLRHKAQTLHKEEDWALPNLHAVRDEMPLTPVPLSIDDDNNHTHHPHGLSSVDLFTPSEETESSAITHHSHSNETLASARPSSTVLIMLLIVTLATLGLTVIQYLSLKNLHNEVAKLNALVNVIKEDAQLSAKE